MCSNIPNMDSEKKNKNMIPRFCCQCKKKTKPTVEYNGCKSSFQIEAICSLCSHKYCRKIFSKKSRAGYCICGETKYFHNDIDFDKKNKEVLIGKRRTSSSRTSLWNFSSPKKTKTPNFNKMHKIHSVFITKKRPIEIRKRKEKISFRKSMQSGTNFRDLIRQEDPNQSYPFYSSSS